MLSAIIKLGVWLSGLALIVVFVTTVINYYFQKDNVLSAKQKLLVMYSFAWKTDHFDNKLLYFIQLSYSIEYINYVTY